MEIRAIRCPSKGKFAVSIEGIGEWDCDYPPEVIGDEHREVMFVESVLDQLVAQHAEKQAGACV